MKKETTATAIETTATATAIKDVLASTCEALTKVYPTSAKNFANIDFKNAVVDADVYIATVYHESARRGLARAKRALAKVDATLETTYDALTTYDVRFMLKEIVYDAFNNPRDVYFESDYTKLCDALIKLSAKRASVTRKCDALKKACDASGAYALNRENAERCDVLIVELGVAYITRDYTIIGKLLNPVLNESRAYRRARVTNDDATALNAEKRAKTALSNFADAFASEKTALCTKRIIKFNDAEVRIAIECLSGAVVRFDKSGALEIIERKESAFRNALIAIVIGKKNNVKLTLSIPKDKK